MPRHFKRGDKVRAVRRATALERPELRHPPDGFLRSAPATPVGFAIKQLDPDTQALIDAAVKQRKGQP